MTQVPVPRRFRDITNEWLTDAMRSTGVLRAGERVAGSDFRPIGSGAGFAARCALGALQYEPEHAGPETVVLKLASNFPNSRALASEHGIYRVEAMYYQHLAARTPVDRPRCYWSGYDEETADFVILLEDLSAHHLGSHVTGCSEEEARMAIEAIARVHAAWWQSPELPDLEWLPSLAVRQRALSYDHVGRNREEFREAFAGRVDSRTFEAVDGAAAGMRALERWAGERPFTLLHGDFRLENLFFLDGGEGLALLDWQLAARGPAGCDTGYFLAWNLTPDQRRAWERSLLDAYCDALQSAGVRGYSRAHCWDDYRLGVLSTCLFVPGSQDTLLWHPVPPGTGAELAYAIERGRELMLTMLRRSTTAALETGALDLVA